MIRELFLFYLISFVFSCTNLIATKGASATGDNLFAYNGDSGILYGSINHQPETYHADGTYRQIIEGDTGHYLGQIPEAQHTFTVVGLMNQYQLSIGETTYGGLDNLQEQDGAIIDYNSLMQIALERCKTASDAITLIDQLVQEYGYYSEGESFTIADKNDIWIMELIGKGNYEKGAVWVAQKLPDGVISGHANQARIQTFAWDDQENVRYSPDVMTFAKSIGAYPQDGTAANFSFSDVYNPITAESARFCDARVWGYFYRVLGNDTMGEFGDYALGKNLTKRMSLYYHLGSNPKVSLKNLRDYMGDHFEGTILDPTQDIGALAFNFPHRWRPLTYQVNHTTYLNERSAGAQQTAYSFIYQIRTDTHPDLGGIVWLAVDDSTFSLPVPHYSVITDIHPSLTDQTGNINIFSFDSAFWVFNLVANWAYTRYNAMAPEIFAKKDGYLLFFQEQIKVTDDKATQLLNEGLIREAVAFLTQTCYQWQANVTLEWLELFKYLFTKYMDGNVKYPVPGKRDPDVEWPGYGASWQERIVKETGNRYLYPDGSSSSSSSSSSSTSTTTSFSSSLKSLSHSTSEFSQRFLASAHSRIHDSSAAKGKENGEEKRSEATATSVRRAGRVKGL